MKASVTYYESGEAVESEGRWEAMPLEGVLWVTVRVGELAHELLGADGYWVQGDCYGMTFEDAQPLYGGRLYAAYEVARGEIQDLGDLPPPKGVRVLQGKGLPDEEWGRLRSQRRR